MTGISRAAVVAAITLSIIVVFDNLFVCIWEPPKVLHSSFNGLHDP
jgi:hypothetical protein